MNILEIFSCAGGMAEGFRRAGLPVTLAIDWDADACASYEANLGHAPIRLDVHDLVRMARAGWRPGEIDLLVADPPCKPWSRAGKRLGQADERDMLGATIELIGLLEPRAWLVANVPGLDDGPNWPVVQRTIGSLAAPGACGGNPYCIDFARLDAADYGVPQHRVRPFWFGHFGGSCVLWPERTHGSPGEAARATLPGIAPLRAWITCRQALAHLSPEDLGSPVRLRWRGCSGRQIASVPDAPARVVGTSTLSDGNVLACPDEAIRPRRHRPHGDGALLTHERHPINRPDDPSLTLTTKGNGQGAQGACVMAWPWDRPATTIHEDDRIPPPGHHDEYARSLPTAVKLSERAGASLQGFPASWVFSGKTKRSRWSQIGMAMPPPLAEAVARQIRLALPERRPNTLESLDEWIARTERIPVRRRAAT